MWGGKDKLHGFKWDDANPDTVRHVCPHCHASITQADYLKGGQPMTGTWVCQKTGLRYGPDRVWRTPAGMPANPPISLGAHIWAAYSPQRSWASIVKEFLEAVAALAKGDAGLMQLFVNETLGETWELQGDRSDEHALQARAEEYDLCTVPVGGLVMTCGVDVQRNRWELAVWAWGRGMESWAVDHHIIDGNPGSDADWENVTTYLQRRYPQVWGGGSMGISAITIDSSDQTQAVYNWVRRNTHTLPYLRAIKGSSEENKPILGPSSSQEVNWRGQKWSNGIKLWSIGVDTAKDLLLGQLSLTKPGPGYVHFSHQLPREWFEQLTAEQRILAKVAGRDAYKWVKRRQRNEVLDCRNYALHAAFSLGLHNYTDKRWTALETAVQPSIDDMFSTKTATSPQEISAISYQKNSEVQPPTPAAAPRSAPPRPFSRDW